MSRPAAPLPPAAARQGLEAAAARVRGAGDMSRRKQSNPRQIKRSLRDMEAREETQAMDISPMEREATSPEAPAIEEPPSPPREDMNPSTVPAPPGSPEGPEDVEGQELEMGPQDEEKEEEEEEAAIASPWSGPGYGQDRAKKQKCGKFVLPIPTTGVHTGPGSKAHYCDSRRRWTQPIRSVPRDGTKGPPSARGLVISCTQGPSAA